MARSIKTGIWLFLALSVLALAAFSIIMLREKTSAASAILEIKDAVSGKVKGSWPVNDNDEFAIEFIHSVNQSPVREYFKVEGKEIQSVSVRFYSFGAGMESEVEEGQTMTRDGDALVLSGLDRTFTELYYIVGTVSDHLLIINGETISLTDLCGKNAHITLRIR